MFLTGTSEVCIGIYMKCRWQLSYCVQSSDIARGSYGGLKVLEAKLCDVMTLSDPRGSNSNTHTNASLYQNTKSGSNGVIHRPSRIREGPILVPKRLSHHTKTPILHKLNLAPTLSHTTLMSKSGSNGVIQRPSRIREVPILVPTQVLHHIQRQICPPPKDPLGSKRIQY